MAPTNELDPQTHIIRNPEAFRLPTGYRPSSPHHRHQTSFTSTRTARHRGHSIKVRTTYRVEIDSEPLTLHTVVLDDGTVHCHGLPNYSFRSAIDLAKALIDATPLAKIDVDEIGRVAPIHHDDGDPLEPHAGRQRDNH